MVKKETLRELLTREAVLAPCIFDCSSARAAELSGFKALMLSGAELSMSMNGLPDLGLLSLDDLTWAVTRITSSSPLPMAVDIEDGFGPTTLHVFHTCERIAKAGAGAVLLEDEADPGFARDVVKDHLLPRKDYIAKVRAAVSSLKGSSCMLIARTNVSIQTPEGLQEGISRCLDSLDAGADMTVIIRLNSIKDAKTVSDHVPGWKVFPDLNQNYGLPAVRATDVFPLGFRFVTMHYMIKAAMAGMLSWGEKNYKDQSNLFSNEQKPFGIYGQSGMGFFRPQEWLDLEGSFTGKEPVKFRGVPIEQDRS